MPKAAYIGKAVTAQVLDAIPKDSLSWQSRQVELRTNNPEGEAYNFISRIFARQYVNKIEPAQKAFLVVLDAGNFHYPNVCFRGAGFTPEELPSRELNLGANAKLTAHLLLNKKGKEEYLSIYWICIDKKIVPTWAEQKAKQLFYSLFNKKRVGLMVRVDVPVVDDVDKTVGIAEGFLKDVYGEISLEYREYIFGAHKSTSAQGTRAQGKTR